MKTKYREVLVKASELISKRGLARGHFSDHGRFCMLGAINHVTYFQLDKKSPSLADKTFTRAANLLDRYIKRQYGPDWDITRVNDDPTRTETKIDAAVTLLEASRYRP